MTKIMLLGDTHGNTKFIVNYAIPAAVEAGVEWIYQVGDFGYWEHESAGEYFLNDVQAALVKAGLNLLFIAGNHDKTSMIPRKYSKVQDFYPVRSAIWFAPNGTHWEFEGKSFVAFGGAYSVDKDWRIEQEKARANNIVVLSPLRGGYSEKYILQDALERTAETLWFPEEEMTDDEMDGFLKELAGVQVDVMLAHDKPLASNSLVKLLPIPECIPNQRRLQKAVNTLQPKLFVHGHLHVRYTDTIRCGDDNAYTRVEGLGADVPNFNQLASSWEPSDAWEILDLKG
jgi:predicted phosphodiesterase